MADSVQTWIEDSDTQFSKLWQTTLTTKAAYTTSQHTELYQTIMGIQETQLTSKTINQIL